MDLGWRARGWSAGARSPLTQRLTLGEVTHDRVCGENSSGRVPGSRSIKVQAVGCGPAAALRVEHGPILRARQRWRDVRGARLRHRGVGIRGKRGCDQQVPRHDELDGGFGSAAVGQGLREGDQGHRINASGKAARVPEPFGIREGARKAAAVSGDRGAPHVGGCARVGGRLIGRCSEDHLARVRLGKRGSRGDVLQQGDSGLCVEPSM